jgi:hypothetical protein
MIPGNVIHRVFRIRVGEARGTAFTLDVDSKQYLITARHIAHSIVANAEIFIFGNDGWKSLPANLVGHCQGDIDISVLAPSTRLTPPNLPLKTGPNDVYYSQDVFFLGFPYDFLGNIVLTEHGYPLPFVKKAIISCFDKDMLLLDGHNNPGFSGGPVTFEALDQGRAIKVASVISGYKAVHQPVYAGPQETPLEYLYNTGIIVSYSIEHALAAIAANPVGLPVD